MSHPSLPFGRVHVGCQPEQSLEDVDHVLLVQQVVAILPRINIGTKLENWLLQS